MSTSIRQIDSQCKITDFLSLPQLETIIPPHLIQDVLTQCDSWERREKKISMQSMIYLIIALSLYPTCSTREVWRRLMEGLSTDMMAEEDVPTAGALCQRRQQLGVTPLRQLFTRCVHPIAHPNTTTAFRFGLRLVAVDGIIEHLADTDANRVAYPYHCEDERYRSPFPQLRCLALMECGTHAIFDVEMSTVLQGETTTIHPLLERSLTSEMLLLCDAGITCYHVVAHARRKQAHILGRIDSMTWRKPLVHLHDGSYLARMSITDRHMINETLTVRIIEYRLRHPQTGELSKVIRLATTLLDPMKYPLEDLIRLYHERWEIELAFDEIETHLSLSHRTLRSQTPQGVEQEMYGLLLAYFSVRSLMYLAALQENWDPDEVSFVHTINVLQRSQWRLMQAPSWMAPQKRQELLQEIRQERLPKRRIRFYARVLKRTFPRYKHKRYEHLHVQRFDGSFMDLVVLLI